jgi:hypothetical protein
MSIHTPRLSPKRQAMKGWKLEGAHLAALRAELEGDKSIRRIVFVVDDDSALEIKVITPATDGGSPRVWLTRARTIPFGFLRWRF